MNRFRLEISAALSSGSETGVNTTGIRSFTRSGFPLIGQKMVLSGFLMVLFLAAGVRLGIQKEGSFRALSDVMFETEAPSLEPVGRVGCELAAELGGDEHYEARLISCIFTLMLPKEQISMIALLLSSSYVPYTLSTSICATNKFQHEIRVKKQCCKFKIKETIPP